VWFCCVLTDCIAKTATDTVIRHRGMAVAVTILPILEIHISVIQY